MRNLSRRQFARLALSGVAMSALSNCAFEEPAQIVITPPARGSATQVPTSVSSLAPTSVPTATLAPTRLFTPTATPAPTRALLRNQNVPGFFVRYYKPFESLDPKRWHLSVDGLVLNSQDLSMADVLSLERVAQVSRMKCVECWSAAAKWEGFHLRSLLELVNPHPQAAWIHMHCADGYYESMSIEALLGERVLFVHHMNDEILPDIYGAPLRLLVPSLYGYKSAKAIVRLEFSAEELAGYWPAVGPYTRHGVIKPGRDHPLDLEGNREIKGGGEIFYPDGIEWQDRTIG